MKQLRMRNAKPNIIQNVSLIMKQFMIMLLSESFWIKKSSNLKTHKYDLFGSFFYREKWFHKKICTLFGDFFCFKIIHFVVSLLQNLIIIMDIPDKCQDKSVIKHLNANVIQFQSRFRGNNVTKFRKRNADKFQNKVVAYINLAQL